MKDKKIIFMGTPQFSVPVLEMLIRNYTVIAVVTQPDRKLRNKISVPPIKELAQKHNIKIYQPNKLSEIEDQLLQEKPDLIITCAFGQILRKNILELPTYGSINVHASLLPKLRGSAPIHRAIIEGYSKTGITIMYMDEGIDTGDIISQQEIAIEATDTASTLHDKLGILGSSLLEITLPHVLNHTETSEKQKNEEHTYAKILNREDELLNFNKTNTEVYNQIRGLNEWPGAYLKIDNKILKVWESELSNNQFETKAPGQITEIYKTGFGIKCKDKEIILKTVQPEGKKRMNAGDYARGQSNHKDFYESKINYE